MRNVLLLVISVLFCFACSSTSALKSDPDTKIFELSNQYVQEKELGSPPYELPKDKSNLRLSLTRKDTPDEIAIILFPGKADGDIEIKLREQKTTIIESSVYKAYFDEILKIQRLLFRDELKDANVLIEELRKNYGESYAYFVLKGILLGRIGKTEQAQYFLRIAAEYNPDSKEISNYFEDNPK